MESHEAEEVVEVDVGEAEVVEVPLLLPEEEAGQEGPACYPQTNKQPSSRGGAPFNWKSLLSRNFHRPCWSDSTSWLRTRIYDDPFRRSLRGSTIRDSVEPERKITSESWIKNKGRRKSETLTH